MNEILRQVVGDLICQLMANFQETEAGHYCDDERHRKYQKDMRARTLALTDGRYSEQGLVR
jgi:hypothetical protein